MRIIVSISDMKTSKRSRDMLVTHSLGSCLGLCAYDPKLMIGGLIHCLLPRAQATDRKAIENPYMFVNTGIPAMVRALYKLGAKRSNLVFKAAGCARMMNVQNQFDTGAKNLAALERLFLRNNIELAAKDVGGTIPRTMYLHMETGKVFIRSRRTQWEI